MDQSSFSLSDALRDELKYPIVFRRRILSSLPIKSGTDDEEEECGLNEDASPLLSKMNLRKMSSAEEQKSSNKCGKAVSEEYLQDLSSKITHLIKEHSVILPKQT